MIILVRKQTPTMNGAQCMVVRKLSYLQRPGPSPAKWAWSHDYASAHEFTGDEATGFIDTLVCPEGYLKILVEIKKAHL